MPMRRDKQHEGKVSSADLSDDNAAMLTRQLSAEPMARHTSWRAGGPAALYFKPQSRQELTAYMKTLPEPMPICFIGLGSNLLVRDGGLNAAVIAVQDALTGSTDLGDGRVYAGAGLACTVFARQCVRKKLGPAAFFAGIPGTIGGALRMNAGAFGGETWDQVESVEVIDRQGNLTCRLPEEYAVGYRDAQPKEGMREEWFIGATFRFEQHYDTSIEKMRALVNQRKQTQPLGLPSCGSVFRNPPGDHAARLIEASGLKGFMLGGAQVSEKHANFIINTGTATATDIESLIEHVHATISEQHGIDLVREVHIVGDPLPGVQP